MTPVSPVPNPKTREVGASFTGARTSPNEMKLNANQRRVLQLLEQAGALGALRICCVQTAPRRRC
jgi:hypothetical protein